MNHHAWLINTIENLKMNVYRCFADMYVHHKHAVPSEVRGGCGRPWN